MKVKCFYITYSARKAAVKNTTSNLQSYRYPILILLNFLAFFLTFVSFAAFNMFVSVITVSLSTFLAVISASVCAATAPKTVETKYKNKKNKQPSYDFVLDYGFSLSVLTLLITSLNVVVFVSLFSDSIVVASFISSIFLVIFFIVLVSRVGSVSSLFKSFTPPMAK